MSDLDYGLVYINKGKFKGQIGVYDDDEGEKAVVYPGDALGYVEIKHDYLQGLNEQQAMSYISTFGNPMLRSVVYEDSRSFNRTPVQFIMGIKDKRRTKVVSKQKKKTKP